LTSVQVVTVGSRGAADVDAAIASATADVIVLDTGGLAGEASVTSALVAPFAERDVDAVVAFRPGRSGAARAAVARALTAGALSERLPSCIAVNATLLKSIPLRSHGVGLQVELLLKLVKRRARLAEVTLGSPSRAGSDPAGAGAREALLALRTMVLFGLVDDAYRDDEFGSHILTALERARRFNLWMGETLRPYVGQRVLEIGAGIGSLTSQFIPRELYVASDVNASYLHYLRAYAVGKPYLQIREIDAGEPGHFVELANRFDTVLMLNVLEHVPDEGKVLRNVWSALAPGGRAVVLVPQHPALYGTLDAALEHRERYTEPALRAALTDAGFRIDRVFDFNRFCAPGWWVNGKLLRRTRFSRVQLKLVDTLMPILKRIDRRWPWSGISLVGIGVKGDPVVAQRGATSTSTVTGAVPRSANGPTPPLTSPSSSR
jgi:SAM-dependent methyltransferase